MTALLAGPAERRRSVRFLPAPETTCRLADGQGERLWPAHVRDLSASNIGLIVGEGFEVGALLAVEVFGPDHAYSVLAVCTRRERVASGWVLGCEFAMPLPAEAVNLFCHGASSD
jgi:hypothetical protein